MARITQIRWAKRTLCKIEAKLRKYCHNEPIGSETRGAYAVVDWYKMRTGIKI